MRNFLLSIAALSMLGFICCNHHKSYIDVEKVIDSVSNEALNDSTIHVEVVDSVVTDSLVVI